jgi:hypothetical protein
MRPDPGDYPTAAFRNLLVAAALVGVASNSAFNSLLIEVNQG